MGKLTPALVLCASKMPDGLINGLTVQVEGVKEPITHDLRDFTMMENDFLKLTQPLH